MTPPELDRELYLVPEAARLLAITPSTLRNWLDGYARLGTAYPPVIRTEPTGSEIVTWGEFVEAGYLKEYRDRRVPLQRLRPFVDALRHAVDAPYPLAHYRPYVGEGRQLALELQEEVGLEDALQLVIFTSGQLVLSPPAQEFFDKVVFEHDLAARLYPDGRESPVTIDPEQAFGIPTVEGVRTEILYEMWDAGDSFETLAEGYEFPVAHIEAAIRFEARRARKTPELQPTA